MRHHVHQSLRAIRHLQVDDVALVDLELVERVVAGAVLDRAGRDVGDAAIDADNGLGSPVRRNDVACMQCARERRHADGEEERRRKGDGVGCARTRMPTWSRRRTHARIRARECGRDDGLDSARHRAMADGVRRDERRFEIGERRIEMKKLDGRDGGVFEAQRDVGSQQHELRDGIAALGRDGVAARRRRIHARRQQREKLRQTSQLPGHAPPLRPRPVHPRRVHFLLGMIQPGSGCEHWRKLG